MIETSYFSRLKEMFEFLDDKNLIVYDFGHTPKGNPKKYMAVYRRIKREDQGAA